MSDPSVDAALAKIDPERLEAGAIAKVVALVLKGDDSAALILQRLLKPHQERKVAEAHRVKIEDCLARRATAELAQYLGECGESLPGLSMFLDRQASAKELEAYERGVKLRQLEVRALQLHRMRSGEAVEKWMTQR